MSQGDEKDYRALVKDAVLDEARFVRLTLSGPRGPGAAPWEKIAARPVEIKEGRCVQFTFTASDRATTRNCSGGELRRELNEVLALPFSNLHVETTEEELHIRVTRKGRVLVSKGTPSRAGEKGDLAHDRAKQYLLPAGGPDDFLRVIGIANEQGEVRPSMQAKFRQVNGFLGLLEPLARKLSRDRTIRLVDCGCGSAHLTFAACHYLRRGLGLDARLVGIDRQEEVIEKCERLREELGWEGLEFRVADIAAYEPGAAPDLVFSLHACDTATDEALARGVLWGSGAIVAAPCCQHELHRKLRVPAFAPVLRHGILRERLSDILTDAFRAILLRIAGYRVQVVEFVAPEFTPKNLVLRAEKGIRPGRPETVDEYLELKKFWGVAPALEGMLGERVQRYLGGGRGAG